MKILFIILFNMLLFTVITNPFWSLIAFNSGVIIGAIWKTVQQRL